jgi:hypothetical protein
MTEWLKYGRLVLKCFNKCAWRLVNRCRSPKSRMDWSESSSVSSCSAAFCPQGSPVPTNNSVNNTRNQSGSASFENGRHPTRKSKGEDATPNSILPAWIVSLTSQVSP